MKISSHLTAILQAIFVTFLWSTSWVLIKFGLRDNNLPAITFAGLRYGLAFLCLIPFMLANATQRSALKNLTRHEWGMLALLGMVIYTLAQGAQFLSLAYLPAVMVNLLLNLTPIFVGLMTIFWFDERPSQMQWLGIVICMAGTALYFLPVSLSRAQIFGVAVALVGILTNAGGSLLGRQLNRGTLSPLLVTFVSMGIGSILMLVVGLVTQGLGKLSLTSWLIIAWLAIVNTAFAFTLWNKTLRTLTAVESSVINSLMMPQIAIVAVIFLGETLSIKEIAGLLLVGVGVLVVQLKKKIKPA